MYSRIGIANLDLCRFPENLKAAPPVGSEKRRYVIDPLSDFWPYANVKRSAISRNLAATDVSTAGTYVKVMLATPYSLSGRKRVS